MHDPVAMNSADDREDVVIGRQGEAAVTFGPPVVASDGSGMRIPLHLTAGGLNARTAVELESWSGGARRLVQFFADLAASWQGWTGTKDWKDDGPGVSISATHDGVGLVILDITSDPFAGLHRPGSWKVAVRVPVEPGSLDFVAARLAALVQEPDGRSAA
jgi:hypothetical protein